MARRRRYPWYDSVWLDKFEDARETLRRVRPDLVDDFTAAFDVFRTNPDFETKRFDLAGEVLDEVRAVAVSLTPNELELHEARRFRRFVVHDHPFFTDLQDELVAAVSAAAGEPLEPAYNFLSLYGADGVCPPHMDSPRAKWTLDFCLDQHAPWPLFISQVRPWPDPGEAEELGEDWPLRIVEDPDLHFDAYELLPGQGLLFSGSSQFHFRHPMPPAPGRRHCDLLFLHYIPAGCGELVDPANWADLFDVPELVIAPDEVPRAD